MKLYSKSENVQQVKSFYDALSGGDLSTAFGILNPDLEWKEPNVPALWFRGIHYGIYTVRKEIFEPIFGKLANFEIQMKKLFEVGEHVIAIGHCKGISVATGKELDAAVAHIWTLKDGKATRIEACHDISKWLEAILEPSPVGERLAA